MRAWSLGMASFAAWVAACCGEAALASPIVLEVEYDKVTTRDLLADTSTTTAISPVQFQLTIDLSSAVISLSPTTTVDDGYGGSVTTSQATFDAPSISETPFVSQFLSLNTQGNAVLSSSGSSHLYSRWSSGSSSGRTYVDAAVGLVANGANGSQFSYQVTLSAEGVAPTSEATVATPSVDTMLAVLTSSPITIQEIASNVRYDDSGHMTEGESRWYDGSATVVTDPAAAVPEPATLSLLAVGLLGLIGTRCRQNRAA